MHIKMAIISNSVEFKTNSNFKFPFLMFSRFEIKEKNKREKRKKRGFRDRLLFFSVYFYCEKKILDFKWYNYR